MSRVDLMAVVHQVNREGMTDKGVVFSSRPSKTRFLFKGYPINQICLANTVLSIIYYNPNFLHCQTFTFLLQYGP
jgi:hypothetical protein